MSKIPGRAPIFPVEPKPGDYVFFTDVFEPQRARIYGKIRHRKLDKWKVDLENSSSTMTFDPKTGVGTYFRSKVQLAWVCDNEELKDVKDYNVMAAMVNPGIAAEYRRRVLEAA